MIDTHTHLYSRKYEGDSEGAVSRALAAGVSHMVLPNCSIDGIGRVLDLHRRFPEQTSVAMGLHPTELSDHWEADMVEIERLLDGGGCVAVGEVGIDLYWDKSRLEDQRKAFYRQLLLALDHGLPVIIHCREALDDTLEVLRLVLSKRGRLPGLVFHSFTGSSDDVRRIREVCDPMFGLNGVVTFKNSKPLQEAVPEIGLDRIMLETDSPYLAPVPHRGKRNESAYIGAVRDKVAGLLGVSSDEVERITDSNARAFFRL